MTEDNIAFYTLNNTFTSAPLKQKVYAFTSPSSQIYKNLQNPQHIKLLQPEIDLQPDDLVAQPWRPRLPTKKLFDDPRFFISIERRKHRILSGLKNINQFNEQKEHNESLQKMQGKKIRSRNLSFRKTSSTLEPLLPQHGERPDRVEREWERNNRTPYLNFNIQYLIAKRKTMLTPTPGKTEHKSSSVSSIRFNESFKYK